MGQLRPIINLKPLNRYITTQRFRMTTIKDVFQLLQRKDWAICLDLKDAYFHVPVHPRHRRFLQFIWRGQAFHYKCLLFGLSSSPRVFTRITKPVVHCLRTRGVKVVFYLDDMLVLGSSRSRASHSRNTVIRLLEELGFSLNWEKSQLTPRQRFIYLGLQWDSRDLSVSLPGDKREELRAMADNLLRRPTVSARQLMSFLGKTTFVAYAVPLARLHTRELQKALRSVYKKPTDICKRLYLPAEARSNLLFWRHVPRVARPLRRPDADVIMATDASGTGWGASLHSRSASGQWSAKQTCLHISQLELLAVHNALLAFQQELTGRTVCVQIDNTTTVSYLAKEGGTRSPPLSRLACSILLWCQQQQISLLPVYVRGMGNTVADYLSRGKTTEWFLSPATARRIFHLFGTPDIDLFASRTTAQLPKYMSLDRRDHHAYAVDALSQPWTFPLLYAFPPPTLVPTVVNKLRGLPCKMLLIAPCWSDAPWLPMLLEMLCDLPRRIRPTPTLLTNTATGYPVSNSENLHLTVWPLCGRPQAVTCNRLLSPFWKIAGGEVPADSTRMPSVRGQSGVTASVWTHLQFL